MEQKNNEEPLSNPHSSDPSPLSKIFDRMHSLSPGENTYASITNSMYQSLQTNKPPDRNNNDKAQCKAVCTVLVANILATHAETFRHAGMMHCTDCKDYADSLRDALPHLEPRVFGKDTECSVHPKVS